MSDEVLDQSLESLAAFLRAELFAVRTYDAALERVCDADLRAELARLRNSHYGRALVLRERLDEFGGISDFGEPEPWGAFAAVHQHVADADSESDALAAIEEGEAWGLRDYEIDLDEVEPHLRQEIERILMPEQARTLDLARTLARAHGRDR